MCRSVADEIKKAQNLSSTLYYIYLSGANDLRKEADESLRIMPAFQFDLFSSK